MNGFVRAVACGAFVLACGGAGARQAPPVPHESAAEIGSLRNSRVALPMPPGERAPVTFLAGPMSEDEAAAIRADSPNLRLILGLSREQALELAPEADGVDARFATAEFIGRAPKLVWVQAMSAGVDRYLSVRPLAENDRIVLTNMRAVHGPAIADHAFAMLLTLTRNMRFHARSQEAGEWSRADAPTRSQALQGKTMLVVGLGGIGTEIAQRAHGFGMRVIATRRTETPGPDYIARLGGPKDLMSMLPEADVVAVCVPLTPDTERLIGAAAFRAMKPGAYLINIARGRIIDTDALVSALRDGKLGGACLDVTDPEPLPAGHPLWTFANVVITPHVSNDAELTDERAVTLVRENLRRFCAGEPLMNVVDKRAGY